MRPRAIGIVGHRLGSPGIGGTNAGMREIVWTFTSAVQQERARSGDVHLPQEPSVLVEHEELTVAGRRALDRERRDVDVADVVDGDALRMCRRPGAGSRTASREYGTMPRRTEPGRR